jgi:hypothetical protein
MFVSLRVKEDMRGDVRGQMYALRTFQRRRTMKLTAMVLFAFLAGSIALAGQSTLQNHASYGLASMEGFDTTTNATVPGSSNATFSVNPPAGIGCPVRLRAQHRADGGLVNVDKGRPQGIAQALHLMLTNPDSRRMIAARVSVRGLSGRGHVTKGLSGPDHTDVTRTLDVQLAQGPGQEVSGDLRVPGMTAVLSIDLNSVTFADGSTRSFAERGTCRVAPDPFMLIAGR